MQVDDYDDYDEMLPSQFFGTMNLGEPLSPDCRIAWKKLHRDACDCLFGPPKQRLAYINEVSNWLDDKNAPYPFDFWVEKLNERDDDVWLDRQWLFDGLKRFLLYQRRDAMNVLKGKPSENVNDRNFAKLDRLTHLDRNIAQLKGRRGAPGHRVIAHLVTPLNGLFTCNRCGLTANRIDFFEEMDCESINFKASPANGFRDGLSDGEKAA